MTRAESQLHIIRRKHQTRAWVLTIVAALAVGVPLGFALRDEPEPNIGPPPVTATYPAPNERP